MLLRTLATTTALALVAGAASGHAAHIAKTRVNAVPITVTSAPPLPAPHPAVTAPVTKTAKGKGDGKVTFHDLIITHPIQKSSP